MLHSNIDATRATYITQEQHPEALGALAARSTAPARLEQLGTSEEGRPIAGLILGRGRQHVSLMAGAHADEPVGPATLRLLCEQMLTNPSAFSGLLEQCTFFIIPHINPDGEERNQRWIQELPDWKPMLQHIIRELPCRDIEYGFPDMRPENSAAARWWSEHAPFELHINLHGMPVSEGALLLIDHHSVDQTAELQHRFQAYIRSLGFGFHDHERHGEKGFRKIATGLATTPESAKMKAHFEQQGDTETAACFHHNSMEYIRTLGGDPVSLVTELPLFKLPSTAESSPGRPENYFRWKEQKELLQHRLLQGKPTDDLPKTLTPQPVAMHEGVRMQINVIEMGLQHVLSDA